MPISIGPKVQVEGISEYKSAMQAIITSTKELDSELKASATKFNGFGKAINTNQQKVAALTGKIYNQKIAIGSASGILERVKAKYGENSAEAQKYQTVVNNLTGDLNKLNYQLSQSGGTQFGAMLKDIGNKMQSVGNKMTDFGKKMSTALTLPLAAIGTVATKTYAEVDKTMVLANKTMNNTSEEAGQMSEAMKTAAANSTYDMNDAAGAMLNFARAGLDAAQASNTIAPAMNLAAGEGGDLNQVSQGLIATIRTFKGDFSEASNYADVFASACNNSALDIDSLSNSMSIAAPVFSSVGYKVNDAALYLGTMANAGIDANIAANSLKTGLARLISPAKAGKEAMQQLGISVTKSDGTMKDSLTVQAELHDAFAGLSESQRIAAASAIFGKQQMSSWLALINTAPSQVEDLSDSLDNCTGTTQDMADAMMNGFGGSIERLKSSINVLAYSLGESLSPYIQKVIDMAQDWVDWFNSMDEKSRGLVVTIGTVAAAIGPLLITTGKLISSVGTIANAVGTLIGVLTPVGAALTGIGIAAGALVGIGVAKWMATNEEYAGKLKRTLGEVHDEYDSLADASSTSLSDGLGDLSKYQAYEKVILSLNDVENKSAIQKTQMKQAVDALNGVMPGLSDSFNEETGTLKMTNEQLQTMFERNNQLIAQKALGDAQAKAMEAYTKALLEAQMASDAYAEAEAGMQQAMVDNGQFTQDQIDKINELKAAQEAGQEVTGEGATLLAQYQTVISSNSGAYQEYTAKMQAADDAQIQANKDLEESKGLKEAVAKAGKEVAQQLGIEEGALKKGTNSFIAFKDAQVAGKTALDDTTTSAHSTSDAISEVGDTTDEAAQQAEEAAQKAAEIQKSALESVTSAFESTYDSIAGKSEINMFEKFAPKNDVTVEDMISNMESQNEASQQMLDEQQAVIDKYGDKLGPELISNLQSMGMDAAATWHHMFVTMGQDNADELFEDLGEQFRTGLNLQDTIATEGAKDVTAYQLVLGQLGSEEPDWTKLHDSIQGLDIDADTKAAVQKAADEAKKAGITIPEGLAESIASGETDPQTAIEQLTSATQGAYEGLTQIAEKAGVEVPSSIADGISSGKMSYSDAVQQLASYLSGTDVDWKGEAEKAGNTVSESAATGVEENADKAQNAGSALGDATQAGLASWENSFYNTAVTMGKNVADGLRSKKQSITSAANTAVSGAVSAIQDAAKDMKEAMKFSWNLPKLHGSVPKFAVSMSEAGSGKAKVNIPNIAVGWHYFAEGGILRQPTLIGAIAGEKGDEAVLPLKKLWSEMDKRYAGNNVNCTFYITESGNAEQTAQAVARTLKRELRMA